METIPGSLTKVSGQAKSRGRGLGPTLTWTGPFSLPWHPSKIQKKMHHLLQCPCHFPQNNFQQDARLTTPAMKFSSWDGNVMCIRHCAHSADPSAAPGHRPAEKGACEEPGPRSHAFGGGQVDRERGPGRVIWLLPL